MKRIFTVVILCAAAICAPAATKKKEAAKAPQTVTIPKDAVSNGDGTYSYTDKEGKKWIYTNTPFGVTKTQAAAPAAAAPPDLSSTKTIDKGETVRFESPGPFGTISWEKKKSELTEDERHIFDAQHPKTDQHD